MPNLTLKNLGLAGSLLLAISICNIASAHIAGGPIDVNGNNASASDLAFINCYDDGNGPADKLLVQIEDLSPPVVGLLLNLQITKDNKMTNTTDPISADNKPSVSAVLKAGNGAYFVSVN